MPERDGYIAGVPCWIDTSQPDPEAAVAFYGGLFGWDFADVMPPGSDGKYFIGRIRGGDVAAVASVAPGAPPIAVWNTYIRVQSADTRAGLSSSGHITGDSADASTTGQQFTLSGRVVAETFDGYRLQTSDVRYDHETRSAETDQPVDLDGPGLSVSGQGATVSFDDQTVTIHGRVHAHLIPQVLQQHGPNAPSLQGPP